MLVDSQLKMALGFVVLSPISIVPDFTISLSNSYFSYSIPVTTRVILDAPRFSITILPYLIVLLIYNILVVVMMVWWCYQIRHK
jgi:hypothetical protein